MSGGKSKSVWIWSGLGLVALLAGVVYVGLNPGILDTIRAARWQSSPKEIRPEFASDFDALSTGSPANGDPLDRRFQTRFISLKEIVDAEPGMNHVTITYEPALDAYQPAKDNVTLFSPHYRGVVGPGLIELAGYANRVVTSTAPHPPSFEWSFPNGPIDETISREFALDRRGSQPPQVNGIGIELAALFMNDGFEYSNWRAKGFRDARTKVQLSRGYAWSNRSNGLIVDTVVTALHAAPIRVFAEFYHGDPHLFEMAPELNATIESKFFTAQLLGLYEGQRRQSSSGQSTGDSERTATFFYEPGPGHTYGAFMISPPAMAKQLMLEVRDKSGGSHVFRSFHGSNAISYVSMGASIDEIASLRWIYLPLLTGVSADLPALPPVHPENRDIDNLFAARMPSIEFEDERSLLDFIAQSVQFKDQDFVPELTSSERALHFPLRTQEDRTVASLLQRYEQIRAPMLVRVKEADHTIVVDQPRPTNWWQEIKRRLGW